MGGKSGGKKGPDEVTQTTTSEPPEFVRPYLERALGAAQGVFEQGPQQYFPGQTVVPFSRQTNQALNLQQNRALSGSPVTGAAQDLVTSTLQGDFLNENPFIDATFDRAAGAVGRQLDQTLARSGRDLDANLGVRSDQLNNLANQIYGGNFQAERGRQMQALNSAIPLAREDYFDIANLRDVGGAVESQTGNIIQDRLSRFNFAQQAPGQAVNQFVSQISGVPQGQNTSSSQPVFQNPGGNLLGGALTGASLFGSGGALAGLGGIGGAGGAGLGAFLGLLSDDRTKENKRRIGYTDSGIPIYVYNHIGDPVTRMGVMSSEVREKIPDAVYRHIDGYDRVFYNKVN